MRRRRVLGKIKESNGTHFTHPDGKERIASDAKPDAKNGFYCAAWLVSDAASKPTGRLTLGMPLSVKFNRNP